MKKKSKKKTASISVVTVMKETPASSRAAVATDRFFVT